jgi:nucleotidyltransferase/DNA polymerase involved in DNA repair
MLLTGLRGVGKTVLLNEIERLAKAAAYRTIAIEAHENKPLGPLLVPHLRTVLYELDRMAGAGDKVKRGLAVLRSFICGVAVSRGPLLQKRAASLNPPEEVYVMDVCEADSKFWLLERNPFSGADLYACSPDDVVAAVSEVRENP